MKIAPVADIKAKFSSYLKASQEGPVIVTRNGKPVAVLISTVDEDELERLVLAYTPKFRELLQAAQQQIREGQGISHADLWEAVAPSEEETSKE